jgi:hypothetical protein
MADKRPQWLGLGRGLRRAGRNTQLKEIVIDLNSTPVPGSDGVVDLGISPLDDNQVFLPQFIRGLVLNRSIEKLNTSSGP